MRVGCAGWTLLGMAVFGEAFISRPVLRSSNGVSPVAQVRSATAVRSRQTCTSATRMQVSSTTGGGKVAAQQQTLTGGVDVAEISEKRLFVEFAAFGFFKRTCQLELSANGDCAFSKGMVSPENGAWRIEEEEGTEYLQFSCTLTELYSEIFDVPSSLLFWRVPLRKGPDGSIVLKGGQIISERKELFGLKTTFIDEGNFKARVLADDEEFPEDDVVDISSIKVPEGLIAKKKKARAEPSLTEDVAEPPLPSDLT